MAYAVESPGAHAIHTLGDCLSWEQQVIKAYEASQPSGRAHAAATQVQIEMLKAARVGKLEVHIGPLLLVHNLSAQEVLDALKKTHPNAKLELGAGGAEYPTIRFVK